MHLIPTRYTNAFTTVFPVSSGRLITNIEIKNYKFKALWDTGATKTCIPQLVVTQLGLIPIGEGLISSASQTDKTSKFIIDILLPSSIRIEKIEVYGMINKDIEHLLIGMDIITLGDFLITNNNNQTVLNFGLPSLLETSFSQNAEKQVTPCADNADRKREMLKKRKNSK